MVVRVMREYLNCSYLVPEQVILNQWHTLLAFIQMVAIEIDTHLSYPSIQCLIRPSIHIGDGYVIPDADASAEWWQRSISAAEEGYNLEKNAAMQCASTASSSNVEHLPGTQGINL
jgi:hypothetical protein